MGAALNTEKAKSQQNKDTTKQTLREKEVNEEDVFKAWIKFPSKIRDKQSLHFIFARQPLWEQENMTVTTDVPGDLVATEMNEILDLLTLHLRNELQNDHIKVKINVAEINRKELNLTPIERAKAMADKNEKLRDLCRRLHLDFV